MEGPKCLEHKSKMSNRLAIVAALLLGASAVNAEITLYCKDGWKFSTDGRVSGYLTKTGGGAPPFDTMSENGVVFSDATLLAVRTTSGVWAGNIIEHQNAISEMRVRTGLLPQGFGFNVHAPKVRDWKTSARISLYSSIQADHDKAGATTLDWREGYLKLKHNCYGAFVIGRAGGLFLRQHMHSDYEVMSVGSVGYGGSTISYGRIGMGYLFPDYNAQITYITPKWRGLQISAGAFDPSAINGERSNDSGNNTPSTTNNAINATITQSPRFEGELTYDYCFRRKHKFKLFLSGLFQRAKFSQDVMHHLYLQHNLLINRAEANGLGYGIKYDHKWLGVVLARYHGKGLGTRFMMTDGNALDQQGKERRNTGYYVQGMIKPMDCLRFGVAFGQSDQDTTANDFRVRTRYMRKQRSWNISGFYDINRWVTASAGYTKATTDWLAGINPNNHKQRNYMITAGVMFSW